MPRVRQLFIEKCRHKGLTAPTADALAQVAADDPELRSEWSSMLAHQLPALPDLDALLARLPGLLAWLDEAPARPAPALAMAPMPADAVPFLSAGIRYWGGGLPIETLRFAGSNRLLVEFWYHGTHRVVEPYSIRRARTTGNVLLYAWELAAGHIKAFTLDEISSLQTTNRGFLPRYQIELARPG